MSRPTITAVLAVLTTAALVGAVLGLASAIGIASGATRTVPSPSPGPVVPVGGGR